MAARRGAFLVAGLGNPGKEYSQTRHNAGFMIVDCLAQQFKARFQQAHLHYDLAEARVNGKCVYLIKPLTYMNLSGIAVDNAMKTCCIQSDRLLIVYDDMHLPAGKIRIRKGGSHGGQKGLKSIIQTLETQEIMRLRMGVGIPETEDVVKHVLSPFSEEEKPIVQKCIPVAAQAVVDLVNQGAEYAMNYYNGLNCQSSNPVLFNNE